MREYKDLATAAKEIERGFMGSFLAPSLDNADNWTIDRHDVFQNDDAALIVKRRYQLKQINLTQHR
jgi:hypothetical protein